MEDYQIVDLYWARSESAISETERKYGRMLNSISFSLLSSAEDAEECVNDTYMAAWQSMPEERPVYLGAFLSKIIRRISISRFRASRTIKRGGAEGIIEELSECIPSDSTVESEYENGRLSEALNRFLAELDEKKRVIFVRRYFYSQPIERIALDCGMKVGSVKSVLSRTRQALKELLEEEELL
ncbi:MAG: sigma-70 family RNA polymerase sigma factor [Clostridia bacterium]|nr:sigma-70 family RNA polymerase sigma factor [Clostridia bacterium]